jgi:succinate dehydrogenase/fumarate reductase flavoprotein subunit
MQESLEEGCKNVDSILGSFEDVALKDRTMVWNTDLVEVIACLLSVVCCHCGALFTVCVMFMFMSADVWTCA